ncbi:MAG: OmpA family protein [Taibaiella sp.]|nr:OmpA family protein [Taibaiella sp.]
MKKILLFFVGSAVAISAIGQKHSGKYADSNLYRWVIDVNLKGGALMKDITRSDAITLLNPVNMDLGTMKFSKGMSYGFDAQLGFFFGKKRHFGIGSGIAYFMQQGDMSLDKYHAEYQSIDFQGHVFRQLVTATTPITEKLKITNVNIPLLLKYKKRFNKTWGFTADAGVLFNVQNKNSYTTDASFDYEAIYTKSTTGGSTTYSYDNSVGATDVRNEKWLRSNQTASFFAAKRTAGYNVGLGVAPGSNKGDYSYTTGSIGFLVQPSVNLFLSNNVALNFGLYYMYQPVKNTNEVTNGITNQVGDYSSILKTVGTSNNQSFGGNVGVRFFLGKLKDSDHDGTPDIRDKCPTIPGPGELYGCPDFDHDGIPDYQDSCARNAGPDRYHGCPDGDGDGIPDREDACPAVPGAITLHGCPDKDGDGVADKDDLCPDVKGSVAFRGCPDTDGDNVPDNLDKCPTVAGPESNEGCPVEVPAPPPPSHIDMTTPILFEVNKNEISSESYPILDEAVKELSEDKSVTVVIDGYTDNSGSETYNKSLSLRRANEVKKYLTKKGVSVKRLTVKGNGVKDPIADNATPEGRAQNRRAIMHVKGK